MNARSTVFSGRKVIYIFVPTVALLLFAGAALSLWNIRLIQHRSRIRSLVRDRLENMTLGQCINFMPRQYREHLRACYRHPDQIDLDKIPWNLWSMPAPFFEYAPEPGRQVGGTINTRQMRDRREIVSPKPQGVYRIFITGGSFAFGAGAPDEDSLISSFLERELTARKAFGGRRIELFNAALPDCASTHERIRIENQIAELQPDLAIMLSGGNDVHWGTLGQSVLSFRTYDDAVYFSLMNEALALGGVRPFPAVPPAPLSGRVPPGEVARVFVRNVRLAAHALELAGARCVLVLQPTLSPDTKPLSPGEREWLDNYEEKGKVDYLAECYGRIGRLLDEGGDRLNANLIRVNILDVFRDRADPVFFDLYHTGDKGNEIVARRLAEELTRQIPR